MASRPDRPYSARSRLESARPLNTSPPISRLLTRSHSHSTEDARRYQSSIARGQALGDSAKMHSSPSKTPSLKHQGQPEAAPSRSRDSALAFATFLAVLFLLFWQSLVSVILCISLHSSKQISVKIAQQGNTQQRCWSYLYCMQPI